MIMSPSHAHRRVVIVDGARRQSVDLQPSDFIASGATGDVYRLRGNGLASSCIKLHKRPDSHMANKLGAMVQRPPTGVLQRHGGKDYVRFAWPTQLVEDGHGLTIGFVMPLMDFQQTRSMVTYTERRESQRFLTPEQRSLPRRLAVCANLCALMADLHNQGHAFVDFKDQNVRVYPENDLVGFIDTDGFRIQSYSNRFFPGQHTTPTFNSPESVKGPKSSLGEYHDRFVLGVLLFRVLNIGIHPFQGVPKQSAQGTGQAFDIDQHIEQQLYPYGAHGCKGLAPTLGSLHDFWDSRTLSMFERTFTARDPNQRVSANDWLEHFRQLQAQKRFARCPNHPNDIEHVHFAGNRCPICTAQGLTTATMPRPVGTQSTHFNKPLTVPMVPSIPSIPSIPVTGSALPQPEPQWSTGSKIVLALGLGLLSMALVGLLA